MKITLAIFSFLFITNTFFGQNVVTVNSEKINLIDDSGQKQGVWKLYSTDLSMQCAFMDNVVIDTIKYYKNDTLIFELCPSKNEINDWIYYSKNDTIKGISKNNEAGLYRYYDLRNVKLESKMCDILTSISEFHPHYYGGANEMNKYLMASSLSNLETGTYNVSFVVNKNGYVEQVKVNNSKNKKVKKIIVDVFESMPRWQPAHQSGRMVNATLHIPLKIK